MHYGDSDEISYWSWHSTSFGIHKIHVATRKFSSTKYLAKFNLPADVRVICKEVVEFLQTFWCFHVSKCHFCWVFRFNSPSEVVTFRILRKKKKRKFKFEKCLIRNCQVLPVEYRFEEIVKGKSRKNNWNNVSFRITEEKLDVREWEGTDWNASES